MTGLYIQNDTTTNNNPKFLPEGKGIPHVQFSKHSDVQITSHMKLTGNVPLDSGYGAAPSSEKGKHSSTLYTFGITFVTRKLITRGLTFQQARNFFYEITNRCSYMPSILFHC